MNLKEAYNVLEITANTSPEDTKKKYRELTKKYHPDVNKEAGAEDKFKKINEAYSVIQKGETSPDTFVPININDFINNGRKRRIVTPQIVHLNTSISFKDSIFGCQKDFTYNRSTKCNDCNGNGEFALNNNCKECHGRGVVVSRQGDMVMSRTCHVCGGKRASESCKPCSGNGFVNSNVTINVTVPGGVINGNVLRLEGMGNFVESVQNFFQNGDAYTDAFVHITVDPKPGFLINGKNVETNVEISLLEALQGCEKEIESLDGKKKINIPAKAKNKESVIIPKLGVAREGNQIVYIQVKYPSDIEPLVEFLKSGT